jgi:heterodisulfide reductase subunit B
MPIIFFTHLIGIAFGVDEMKYGLNNQFISPVKTLERWLS